MCWIGKKTDVKVSKEDVQVFKVLYTKPKGWHDLDKNFKREYLAPYYPFRYSLNIQYDSEIIAKGISFNIKRIYKAIHCYSSSCKWEVYGLFLRMKMAWRPPIPYPCGKTSISRYPLQKKETENLVVVVVEGVIPAGTEYWENTKGEIATSRLILKNVKYMYDEKRK